MFPVFTTQPTCARRFSCPTSPSTCNHISIISSQKLLAPIVLRMSARQTRVACNALFVALDDIDNLLARGYTAATVIVIAHAITEAMLVLQTMDLDRGGRELVDRGRILSRVATMMDENSSIRAAIQLWTFEIRMLVCFTHGC